MGYDNRDNKRKKSVILLSGVCFIVVVIAFILFASSLRSSGTPAENQSHSAVISEYDLGTIHDIAENYKKWMKKYGGDTQDLRLNFIGNASDIERTATFGSLVMEYCNDESSSVYLNAKSATIILPSTNIMESNDIEQVNKAVAFISTFLFNEPDNYSVADAPAVIDKSTSLFFEIDSGASSPSVERNHIYIVQADEYTSFFYWISDNGELVISYY